MELLGDCRILLLENLDGLGLLLDEHGHVFHALALLLDALETDVVGGLEGGDVGEVAVEGAGGGVEHDLK